MSKNDDGFTLIEVLVSLSIAAFITSFAIAGLTSCFGVLTSLRQSEDVDFDLAAMSKLRALVSASRNATTMDQSLGVARLLFSGNSQSLELVTLSEGYALEGGPVRVIISLNCAVGTPDPCLLEARTAVYRPNASSEILPGPIVLMRHIKSMDVSYFGETDVPGKQTWLKTWVSRQTLPRAVQIRLVRDRDGKADQFSLIAPIKSASIR